MKQQLPAEGVSAFFTPPCGLRDCEEDFCPRRSVRRYAGKAIFGAQAKHTPAALQR
jgi:hypothetical protein